LSHRDWEPMPSIPGAVVLSLDSLRRGARLVRPAGNLDERTIAGLLSLTGDQLSPALDLLIVDLTNLTTLGPDGVRMLVRMARELGDANVGLALVAPDSVVEPALDEAGVRSLFRLHATIDDALDVP
jgi:anti-anti-sigma factor